MIDQQTVDRIFDAADIYDVVSEYVTLRRSGASYKGLCPFHDDKTPSFYVNPARGICKCFSCGKGGNAVTFIMEIEQMTFTDALRHLAKRYNIEIKEEAPSKEELKLRGEREKMLAANEWASQFFYNNLMNTPEGQAVGLAYFRNRGFRDDIIEKFRLGYAPDKWDALSKEAQKKGFKDEVLVSTSLAYKKDNGQLNDKFRGRVMFPWFSLSGQVLAFGGRVLDARTKGVNQKYIKEIAMHTTETEILQSDPWEVFDEENRQVYENTLRLAMESGEEESCDTWRIICSRICGKDKICVRSFIRMIGKAGSQAIFYAMVQNVTAEKKRYEILRDSELHLRRIRPVTDDDCAEILRADRLELHRLLCPAAGGDDGRLTAIVRRQFPLGRAAVGQQHLHLSRAVDLLQQLREALLLGLNGLCLRLLGNRLCLHCLDLCPAAGRQQEQDQPHEQDDENVFVLGCESAEFSCVHDVLLHSCRSRGIPRSASMICARRLFSAAGPVVTRRTDCGYQ